MQRRHFLAGGALACSAAAAPKYAYRLRYAPHVTDRDVDHHRQLEVFAEQGFQAFECNALPKLPDAAITALAKTKERLNLAMGVFVINRGGWKPSALVDRKFHGDFLADVKRALEIHKIIGNECATATSGLAVDHLSYTQQTTNCIEALKRAGELVEKTKMVIVLEPLNIRVNHAGYFVVMSDHGAEIIANVNHPNVKLLFDIYHQQISEGNVINHLRKHWARIGYLQAGDVPGRKEPGTGEINYQNVFKAVHELGYQGIIGMEHGWTKPGIAGMVEGFAQYQKADGWT
jgi:hydroxypyruvate isomerase